MLAATVLLLVALTGLLLLEGGPAPAELALAVVVALLILGGSMHHRVALAIEAARAERDAGVARILQGLSRSLSPDSIVEGIVDELTATARADHVVVAHLRRPELVVDVTLRSARPGVAPSRTTIRPEVDDRSARHRGIPWSGMPDVADPDPDPTARADRAARAAAEEIARRVRSGYGLSNTLAEPLVADGRFAGALILSRRTRADWTEDERRLLAWSAQEVAAAFARAHALEVAERGATTDALTGLPNRRAFDALIATLRGRRRAGDGFSLLMADIDRFKSLNDRYGHATGDAVLREVAGALAGGLRAGDTAARYGGEEFAIVLRGATSREAGEIAERLRLAVAGLTPAQLGVEEAVTVSIGVATAGQEEEPAAVIARADRALYAAKAGGRDRVAAG